MYIATCMKYNCYVLTYHILPNSIKPRRKANRANHANRVANRFSPALSHHISPWLSSSFRLYRINVLRPFWSSAHRSVRNGRPENNHGWHYHSRRRWFTPRRNHPGQQTILDWRNQMYLSMSRNRRNNLRHLQRYHHLCKPRRNEAWIRLGLSRCRRILRHVRSSVWHLRRNLLFHLST